MSGIVGIVNLDGAPVDRELLWQLTRSIAYRGPDAQEVWVQDHVGFGHTMLRTTFEAESERQPCSLGGESPEAKTWITADCRVDAREELISRLAARGRRKLRDATDPELILHAYAVWGTDCTKHLIGDFAFAIWDAPNRRLFCARDHMGLKPFYYARTANCVVFGNTLASLRVHPDVSDRLDDLAIADYLLFGHNQDLSTTSFEDIRRLPPAHTLLLSVGRLWIERYWTLPIDPMVRFRRRRDYTEHFLDLLRTVVRDRLRTTSAGILMSGGLDSTGLAALAQELGRSAPVALSAHTVVFDRLIPDGEKHYAERAAYHLGIPIHFVHADGHTLYESCQGSGVWKPDPALIDETGPQPQFRELGAISSRARVALFGEGPDNALYYEWKPYIIHEIAAWRFGRLLWDAFSFPFLFAQVPFYTRFSWAAKRRSSDHASVPPFPPWLNREFSDRLQLRERYTREQEIQLQLLPRPEHPVRPYGYSSFFFPLWQLMFESLDPGVTGIPVEVRQPYVDIRMVRYLLAVPPIPWCRNKYLLRAALKSYLPPLIIGRPKTGLQGFPVFERWRESGLPAALPVGCLRGYVDEAALRTTPNDTPNSLGMNLRAVTLGFFLRSLDAA